MFVDTKSVQNEQSHTTVLQFRNRKKKPDCKDSITLILLITANLEVA